MRAPLVIGSIIGASARSPGQLPPTERPFAPRTAGRMVLGSRPSVAERVHVVVQGAARPPVSSTGAGEAEDRQFLPFARPSITQREKRAVLDVLDSGWLTTGARAKEFEARFAGYVGAHHAIAVNSATAALHLALDALGVGSGDEVIVPTWTFTACAEVVVYRGARPVLVDVDRRTLNLTADLVEAALTPQTRAVIAVHVAGRPLDVDHLVTLLDPHGVAVVEDAAHAFPSRIGGPGGRFAGTIGRAGAYSFYATKTITTGEGGMLVTNDDAIAVRARLMALHGISRDAWNRYAANGSWYYEVEDAGYKYNLTDLAAALGLVQLERAEELLAARRAIAARYEVALREPVAAGILELPDDATDGSHAWHLYIVRLALDQLAIDRAAVIEALREQGIGASVHFIPLHLHPYYRRVWGSAPGDCPVATHEYERVMSLPIWPGMTDGDVDRVGRTLGAILAGARRT